MELGITHWTPKERKKDKKEEQKKKLHTGPVNEQDNNRWGGVCISLAQDATINQP